MPAQKNIILLCLLALGACASKGSLLPMLTPESVKHAEMDQDSASYLQLGRFPDRRTAEQLSQRTSDIGVSAYIVPVSDEYQVKSGPYTDADQALRSKLDIDRMLDIEALVVFE